MIVTYQGQIRLLVNLIPCTGNCKIYVHHIAQFGFSAHELFDVILPICISNFDMQLRYLEIWKFDWFSAPERPADIKALPVNNSTVMASWKPPLHSNGILTKYNVYIYNGSSAEVCLLLYAGLLSVCFWFQWFGLMVFKRNC